MINYFISSRNDLKSSRYQYHHKIGLRRRKIYAISNLLTALKMIFWQTFDTVRYPFNYGNPGVIRPFLILLPSLVPESYLVGVFLQVCSRSGCVFYSAQFSNFVSTLRNDQVVRSGQVTRVHEVQERADDTPLWYSRFGGF